MRPWIKVTLLIVAAFALCWAGAIIYWQETARAPSGADLALYLLALPLSLLALFWGGRKLLSLAAATSAAPGVAAAPAAADTPAPAPGPALILFGGAMRTPHGADPAELAALLEEQRLRADLDPDLSDDDGYPIMSVRLQDGPDAGLREDTEAWLHARAGAHVEFSSEQWRALTMGSEVARELVAAALGAIKAPAQSNPNDSAPGPKLAVVLLLAPDWNEQHRAAAVDWIGHLLLEAGWPAGRASVMAPPGPALPALASTLTALTNQAASAAEPVLAMLLAFDSQIGEASVNRLAASGRLMVATRNQGVIPGEGAAGVLLGDARQAALMEGETTELRALSGVREGSADASRRPDAALLRKLTTQALQEAAVAPPALALVLADTDHRTGRTMELMALATEALPHLDPGQDVRQLGPACGNCAAVPYLAAIVLAHQQALERAAAVLCLSNEDPYHRSAVLVRPPAMPS